MFHNPKNRPEKTVARRARKDSNLRPSGSKPEPDRAANINDDVTLARTLS